MWHRRNIRTQLIIIISLIILLIEATTLFFVLNIQNKENKQTAVVESVAIIQSLNNDFLKYFFNPTADMLSDITFRISAFKQVRGVLIYDENKNPIYNYGNIKNMSTQKDDIFDKNIIFTDDTLFIVTSLNAEGYSFGYTMLDIDLSSFKEKQKSITYTILAIFPFALLFGLILSYFLSKSYTQPFINLIRAMRESDPTNNKITPLTTKANNEIKELFNGFNTQMQQISKATKELQYNANHDQLTNTFNRFYMEKKLQESLQDKQNEGYNLLYIDLDQFKLINDSAGYEAGDELLKMVANELQRSLTNDTTLARVDGDTFMILTSNSTKEDGEKLLHIFLEKLKDFRFSWNNEVHSVSASISLIYFESYQYTLKELLKASNTSLYTAKSMGRNKYHIYDPNDDLTNRFITESDTAKMIKEALGDGPARFELFAQDIVPLQYETDKIGYEILIRMWDKDGNFIAPDNFLPAAERYQLMSDIDSWVLWTYLETVTKDKNHIEKLHSAHINLAGSSLNNPDFQAKVKEAIEHFDFPWEKLELEVTESSAIGSFNQANEFIAWLKIQKIGLALDDFGTGMASFEYLKSLPFDVVKIDGSFVKDMHTDPTDKSVIKYIQEIAEFKGQETVAEYVETAEDVETLREIGVTYGQGYFLGKPRALSSWLEN